MLTDSEDRYVDVHSYEAQEQKPKVISLDVENKWTKKPYLSKMDHLADPKLYRVVSAKTVVISLKDKSELEQYNEFQTLHNDSKSDLIIQTEKMQWSETDNNWKVLLKLVYLEYLSLI
jgi:hypothetical protein